MPSVFISYSHVDNNFGERLAKDLNDAGLQVWIDFRSIPGGHEWEQAIFKGITSADFVIVCLSPFSAGSKWVQREVLLARGQNKPILPLIVKKEATTEAGKQDLFTLLKADETLDKLSALQMIDFERFSYEIAFPLVLEAYPKLISTSEAAQPDNESAIIANPFKGLEAFQQTDAHLFFGREALTQKLIDRLSDARADRFLAVVGASGSGKSSLVRAGLIPKLRAGALPESAHFPLVIFTPGPLPTDALRQRLLPVVKDYGLPDTALNVLRERAEGLHVLTEALLNEAPRAMRLILVIDQFEEVFTRASAAEAVQFLDLLVNAVTQPDGRTLVILTMRADFFDRLSGYPALAALFEKRNLVIVTEMQPDELRRSIEAPAFAVGLDYESGLVETILEDVRQQPGSLPLLQYALTLLYKARQGSTLKAADYAAIGGVRGALAGHAEALYKHLLPPQQDLLRRLLLRLVEVSPTGEATRRRVERQVLTFRGVSDDDVQNVIDLLTAPDNRLLVASRTVETEREAAKVTLEVSHEALVREWERLRGWIGDDEANLRYGGDLLKDAQDWAANGRDAEYLITGGRVARAQYWLESADANDLQREFIEASAAAAELAASQREQEQAEKLALAQRAEVAEKARAIRFRRAAIFASVIGFLAVIATIIALGQSTSAQQQLSVVSTAESGLQVQRSELQSTLAFSELTRSVALEELAEANLEIATMDARTTFSVLEISRFSTLNAGEVAVPLGTQTPGIFEPTMTAIANLNAHVPVEQNFPYEDFDIPMMLVPAGCFYMGSISFDHSQPVHQICFEQPLWIDKTEVTNGQYRAVTGEMSPSFRQDAQLPVVAINWFEARDFCAARDARLPTEAEWEYAARGVDSLVYPWGNAFVEDNVVYDGNANQTAYVGSRPAGASWVGALDMAGNVWEWVSSLNESYPHQDDGQEDDTDIKTYVLRGGSFLNSSDLLHVADRRWSEPNSAFANLGFRCVRS